jgi:hypothetical protein
MIIAKTSAYTHESEQRKRLTLTSRHESHYQNADRLEISKEANTARAQRANAWANKLLEHVSGNPVEIIEMIADNDRKEELGLKRKFESIEYAIMHKGYDFQSDKIIEETADAVLLNLFG